MSSEPMSRRKMARATLLRATVVVNIGILCVGCAQLHLQKYSRVPSGAFTSLTPEEETLKNTCIDRLEKARALAEREHSLSSLWSLLLGVAGGISTAVAIVSATEPVRKRLGLAPVIVAVSVSALAAIAAPIAVNQDKAGMAVAQYEVLSQALESGDSGVKDARAGAYRLCSYGYAGFEVPPERRR